MLSLPSNLLNKKNQEEISTESYVSFPSNKLKVIRLTLDDINHEKKIYSNNQQSSLILEEKMKKKDEKIFSPVYESIDEKRDPINRNEKNKYINNDQFEIL
ncbi:unnamed protein product [Rotaria sp. Silwood1]|nr:unnamed protein product [Rotaria sp. Silwood1]CAF3610729.1 unnamed protein product [Rotaria sp. Silwood1]